MQFLYPVASTSDETHLAIKIARHSPCETCTTCTGLRPPPGTTVALDEAVGELAQFEASHDYLLHCKCGHTAEDHGVHREHQQEFRRRAKVAVRLDELLKDAGRLLDFGYSDMDILSLRKQMALITDSSPSPLLPSPGTSARVTSPGLLSTPGSPLTPSPEENSPPPAKRRKLSPNVALATKPAGAEKLSPFGSPLSGGPEEDDDDDEPLALSFPKKSNGADLGFGSSGSSSTMSIDGIPATAPSTSPKPGPSPAKKGAGKTAAHTAPVDLPPPSDEALALMNGEIEMQPGPEHIVKVEDRMDEQQLDHLAAGVAIDSGGTHADAPKPEKAAAVELRKGIIKVIAVENDDQPHHVVILTGLKTLFQKQLPKMPREYIARLVYDANSKGLAIIKRGYKVVGGILYRPFAHRGFAEIVFFATASVDQVKGYGAMLMDHFKTHIRQAYPDMLHFLTYADNYAVGYFRKQGFSKEITLDRTVWAGYIKDYEGGTIMQCTMVRKVDYLNKAAIIEAQKEAIVSKIREMSKSHIVYPGLTAWMPNPAAEGGVLPIDPKDVPGLRDSGWTPESSEAPIVRAVPRSPEYAVMQKLLDDLANHAGAWPFAKPVDLDTVPDYLDVITNPMDFNTMEHKLVTNQYATLEAFVADAQLIFDNCRKYNPDTTVYWKLAKQMDGYLKKKLASVAKGES